MLNHIEAGRRFDYGGRMLRVSMVVVTAIATVGAASLAASVRAETSDGSRWAATVIGGPLIVSDLDAMRSQIPDTPRRIGGLFGVAGHYMLRRGSDYAQFDAAGAVLGNAPFYQVHAHYVFASTKRRPYAEGSRLVDLLDGDSSTVQTVPNLYVRTSIGLGLGLDYTHYFDTDRVAARAGLALWQTYGAVNIDAAVDTSKAFGLRSNGNFIAFSTGNLALAVYGDFAVMINPGDRVHVTALLGLGIGEGLKLRR